MRTTKLLAGVALLVVSLASIALSTPAAAQTAEAVGNAERGKEQYLRHGCFACHGILGQGGSYTGPRLGPNPLPWQVIAAFIRNPRNLVPPYTPTFSVMPAYTAKMVPDADVQDMYAYLKAVPAPTDLTNIPTFKK